MEEAASCFMTSIGGVDVAHLAAAAHVAEVRHGERLALGVRRARVVDEADVVVEVEGDVPGEELLRSRVAVPVELLVVVGPLPFERLGRRAQVDAQDAVHALERVDSRGLDRIGGLAGGDQGAKVKGRATEVLPQQRIHLAGVRRRLGLGHRLLRHDAVLGEDARRHVPLAAVAEGLRQQEGDQPRRCLVTRGRDDVAEPEVGPLELVPVHRVVLAEFEVLDAQTLLRADAHQVEGGEEPAAAALHLVG